MQLSDGSEVSCYSLVLAMGMAVRKLDLPGANELAGSSIFYGASLTEAATFRDQEICIVGAGNSAGQGALFFSRTAKSVTLFCRGNSLEKAMSQYLIDRIRVTPNINVILRVEIKALKGDKRLESVVLHDLAGNADREIPAAAMFVFIGAAPRSEIVAGIVDRDDKGFVLTGPDLIRNGRLPRSWRLTATPISSRPAFPASLPPATCASVRASASPPRSARAPRRSASSTAIWRRSD